MSGPYDHDGQHHSHAENQGQNLLLCRWEEIYWDFTGIFAKWGGRGGDVCYNRKQNDRLGTDRKERCL